MATLTKRGNRWTAQIRKAGFPSQSRTFSNRSEAKAWASQEEARLDRGEEVFDRSILQSVTLGELLKRYQAEVSSQKRGAEAEQLRLGKIRRDKIAGLSLLKLTPGHLAQFRDRRLRDAKPATVHRELALISHALDTGHREWGLILPKNPAKQIAKPSANAARDRRLLPGEYERILQALAQTRNGEVVLAIELAIETGLRRGELLSLTWENVDLDARVAHIPLTKTGVPRTIPLTNGAMRTLAPKAKTCGKVVELTGNALRKSWNRVLQRAGITDLRFHDLRHEAISRFFEIGLSLPEVALISGHRDPRMLLRYTQLRASDLARKLEGRAWEKDHYRR